MRRISTSHIPVATSVSLTKPELKVSSLAVHFLSQECLATGISHFTCLGLYGYIREKLLLHPERNVVLARDLTDPLSSQILLSRLYICNRPPYAYKASSSASLGRLKLDGVASPFCP